MAENSNIEWTDHTSAVKAHVGKDETVTKSFGRLYALLCHPLVYVALTFAAVTATASGNDVARRGQSPGLDRHDVVPCVGGTPAVGALPLEDHRQEGHSLGWHSVDIPAALIDMLLETVPKAGVTGVALPSSTVDAVATLAGVDDRGVMPSTAVSTPRLAQRGLRTPLTSAWPTLQRRGSTTRATHRGPAVASAGINIEVAHISPRSASPAVLFSSRDSRLVLVKLHAETSGCRFDHTCLAAHRTGGVNAVARTPIEWTGSISGVGNGTAGRLLDGVQHSAMPEVAQ